MAQSKDNKPGPKNDERNLVDAAAASSADLEDQLAQIWEDNKKFIIYSIVGVFAIFGIYHFSAYLSQRAKISLQEDYASADDNASKLAFAEKESGNPLGGFAFSELAAVAYEEGDYHQAAEYYGRAVQAAVGAIKDAARMGQAMALLQSGENEQAQSILEEIISNDDAANATEARYRLAELSVAGGDYERARTLIGDIQANASQETLYWFQKSLSLQNKLPPEDSGPTG